MREFIKPALDAYNELVEMTQSPGLSPGQRDAIARGLPWAREFLFGTGSTTPKGILSVMADSSSERADGRAPLRAETA